MQVAWEVHGDCFPGTPAWSSLRLVVSFAATRVQGRRLRPIELYDVSVALYHALLDELVWVDPPNGDCKGYAHGAQTVLTLRK